MRIERLPKVIYCGADHRARLSDIMRTHQRLGSFILPQRTVLFLLALTWAAGARGAVISCDPTRNTLSQCVTSATSNGQTPGTVILVPNATTSIFSLSSTVSIPSNFTLRCEPNATIKQNGATTAMLLANGVHGVTVDGCIVDGSVGATPGLVLNNVSAIRVSHNSFQNFQAEALSAPGGGWTDVEVDSNVFSSAGPTGMNDSAVYLYAQNGSAGSARIKIHDNTCNNIGQQSGCMKFAASSSKPITQIAIANNTLNVGSGSPSNNNLGIEFFAVDGSDSDIQQFNVSDNIVTTNPGSTGTSCISISGRYGVVANNTLSNCQLFGIETIASYANVVGNLLTSAGPIVWDGNSGSHTNLLIANNTTVGSTGAAAIHIVAGSGGSYGLFTGIVGHNLIRSPAGMTTSGILVQTISSGGVADIHIDDNVLDSFSSSQRAIESEGSPAQVQIENNRFVNDLGSGMFLNAGTNITIRLNYFNGATWLSNFGASITRSIENIVNGSCCY